MLNKKQFGNKVTFKGGLPYQQGDLPVPEQTTSV